MFCYKIYKYFILLLKYLLINQKIKIKINFIKFYKKKK